MIYQIKPVFKKKEKDALIKYIKQDNWITEHKITEKFEKSFSSFTNSKHCICFPNGTITMSSVLHCLNLKKAKKEKLRAVILLKIVVCVMIFSYKIILKQDWCWKDGRSKAFVTGVVS